MKPSTLFDLYRWIACFLWFIAWLILDCLIRWPYLSSHFCLKKRLLNSICLHEIFRINVKLNLYFIRLLSGIFNLGLEINWRPPNFWLTFRLSTHGRSWVWVYGFSAPAQPCCNSADRVYPHIRSNSSPASFRLAENPITPQHSYHLFKLKFP